MSRIRAESFLKIDAADLSDYADARAAEIGLPIAAPFRPCVLENLTTLQAHARRLNAALQHLDAAAAEARQI
jgi:hypothetical protein